MASLIANGKQQYFDNAGKPLVGGKLYTYAAGSLVPKATFSDTDGLIPNANPVILDARGEALIFWSGSYKVILKDALGNIIWTVDKINEAGLGFKTSSNGSMLTPSGTTDQRDPAPNPGYFRYNVDLASFEGYYAAAWTSLVKSFNGVTVPDGGDVLLKKVAGVSLLGAGDALVSGVTVKTVGGVSILGAGDVPLPGPAASCLYLNSNFGGF